MTAPLAHHGHLDLSLKDGPLRVRLTRIHLEEDAGKLLHEGSQTDSYADYNRAGVPLLEIVSEPDLRSAEQAYHYLTELKALVQYLDVSTCNMEEGSLRCDTNVSIRPKGSTTLGVKVEIKNLNSFRAVGQAVEHEIGRQTALLTAGQRIAQETRLWDADRQQTFSMRSKEEASDYRYFPEPDLVPFEIQPALIERIRAALPELPAQRRARLQRDYQVSAYDAGVLTQHRALAELFEAAARACGKPKPVANWIMGDLMAYVNAKRLEPEAIEIRPGWLVHLIELIDRGTLSGTMAKDVFVQMLEQRADPALLVEQGGLRQITDDAALEQIAAEVIAAHPKSVDDYAKGKDNVLMYLVGQGMKRSQGKANPQQMTDVLKRKLRERVA